MLTPRELYNVDAVVENNAQLLAGAAKFDLEAVKAAVEKLRRPPVLKADYGWCNHAQVSDGGMMQCDQRATHMGTASCEHEHIYTVVTCAVHKSGPTDACYFCIKADGHTCTAKLTDIRELPHA